MKCEPLMYPDPSRGFHWREISEDESIPDGMYAVRGLVCLQRQDGKWVEAFALPPSFRIPEKR
jgi:hypothetical protein